AAPPPDALAPMLAPAAPPTPDLTQVIDEALAESFLSDATIGIHVLDLQTGKVLYERGASQPLNPASNVKLVTTASALSLLGPEHRYTTSLYMGDDARDGTTIKGNLYLKGRGDPNLVTGDLYEMAKRLRAQGIKKIGGAVVVDASAFDADGLPPGFDQKSEMASYRAPSGATVVNFNTFVIRTRPGAHTGESVIAHVQPSIGYLDLSIEATTAAGHRRRLWAEVEHRKDRVRLVLHGSTGVDAGAQSFRYPVGDPSRYAGEVMTMALQDAGIKVGRRKPSKGKTPRSADLIEAHRSQPLSVLIRSVNKFSNNFMAEQILKTLDEAEPKTFAGALSRVRTHVGTLGVSADGLQLGNGSGLYDNNRVSPAQMTALLASVHADFRIRADFLASLAVMGVDGTTRSRLAETPAAGWVRVKTGTLDGISALSGYVGTKNRNPVVFSILMNDLPKGGTSKARGVQNRIADALSRYVAGRPLTDTEPVAPAAQ
ncbi:MAG: D-alanyl-D-alanine carboxypeptidase/D-alanyl-D-alanine-endopeptidase, partial [Myxococcota bacterium]